MPSLPPITIGNHMFTGPGDDSVHISKAPGIFGALGLYDVNVNGHHQLMTKSQLEHTTFELGGGNDTLVVDPNVHADIHANGGSGNDTFVGGAGDDTFNGGTGRDVLAGGGGVNHLNGGDGRDTFINTGGLNIDDGGNGNDTFWNLGGANLDIGGQGQDTFVNLGGSGINAGLGQSDTFLPLGGSYLDLQ